MRNQFLLIICFFCLVFSGFAEEVKFTARISKKKVAVDEQFELVFTINHIRPSGFIPPFLGDFNVYTDPPAQISGDSEINGKVSYFVAISYVLSCKKVGKFRIAPAKIKAGGVQLNSNALEIEVVKASPVSKKSKDQSDNLQNIDDNVFVRAQLSRSSVSIGEQVTVTYKLYSKYSQLGYDVVNSPSFNGFYSESLAPENKIDNRTEIINGEQYRVVELKKTLLFPQKSGTLEIPQLEVVCSIPQKIANPDPFEEMFNGGYKNVRVTLKSKPVNVVVKPVTTVGKPADYNGAVGQFNLEAKTDLQKLKSGDPLKFTFSISGRGNLRLIETPKLIFPEELEVYDPQVKDDISAAEEGMKGTRSFEFVLIPRVGGNFSLGPFSFSYFDPLRNSYRTITSQKISVQVSGSVGDSPFVKSKGNTINPKEISEIKGIKPYASGFEPIGNTPFFLSPLFYLILLVFPASIVLLLFLRKRKNNRLANHTAYRAKEAGTAAQKRLKKAHILMAAGNKDLFYEEIYRALYGYLSDKLLLPAPSLSRSNIKLLLEKKNVPVETTNRFLEVLDACEFARFAPVASFEMEKTIIEAEAILNATETWLK